MADDMGEKSEDPTPKRKSSARDDGNIAKSTDLSSALMLLVGTMTLYYASLWLLNRGQLVMAKMLAGGTLGDPVSPDAMVADIGWIASQAGRILAPVLLVVWIGGAIGQLMQVGLLFTLKPIQPGISKLNPIKGATSIFGWTGIMKAAIDVCKMLVVLAMAVFTIQDFIERITILPYLFALDGLQAIADLVFILAIRLLAILFIMGLLDYWFQKWKHKKDLKMTKQEVKDEMKQSEGDPQVRKRRARLQQQIAMQRINQSVPQADVIVTNPEHISIAIKYDENNMGAPRVVAKGADHLAMRIRQIATIHGIPIVERKPLARALYRDVEVGQEVPPEFYSAVAEVLAYVYRLGERAAG